MILREFKDHFLKAFPITFIAPPLPLSFTTNTSSFFFFKSLISSPKFNVTREIDILFLSLN